MVALSLSSTDHAELLEQYPYPFKIVTRYTIDSEKGGRVVRGDQ